MADKTRLVRIPQPKALPGDAVSVENYRMRPPMWEHGECTRATFSADRDGSGRWDYAVILNRVTERGSALWLYVGDKRLERDE